MANIKKSNKEAESHKKRKYSSMIDVIAIKFCFYAYFTVFHHFHKKNYF